MWLFREIDILVDFTATIRRETDKNVNFIRLQQGLFKANFKIPVSVLFEPLKKIVSASTLQHSLFFFKECHVNYKYYNFKTKLKWKVKNKTN